MPRSLTVTQTREGRLCRVYEVGEVHGRHYIAMQFISGRTLAQAARELTLEQRVTIMRQVAEAVHAAHRAGLVHRDLKPSNIMIESTEGSGLVPYVVDFGLVRDVAAGSITTTRTALGTPSFMAPEQVQSGSVVIDRRTDVYGLGATLYSVLAGIPPFDGGSAIEILMKVMHDEPASFDRAAPQIPRDLSRIVMKCLEKDPRRRYDSARALAEDLQRYLDGEPVLALPTSVAYRLRRIARRNRALVSVAGIAILIVVFLIGLSINARRTATQRAQIAQQFGQRVERAEQLLWRARTIPLHDIRPTKTVVRKYLSEIEQDMKAMGRVAEGAGHSALGRGYIALGEIDAAGEHLNAAWKLGYQTPDVAYGLGLVLGKQYERELAKLKGIGDDKLRESLQARAQETYRRPALVYLRRGSGNDLATPKYLEALLAFYEGKYEVAVEKAQAAFRDVPWLYEAAILQGKSLRDLAQQLRYKGRYDEVRRLISKSRDAYIQASSVGRSDPEVYIGLADLSAAIVEMDVWVRNRFDQQALDQTVEYAESSLRADPDSSVPLCHMAAAYLDCAEYHIQRGEDAADILDRSISFGLRAVSLDRRNANALMILGLAYWARGKAEIDLGQDPRGSLDRAQECVAEAVRLESGDQADALTASGLVWLDRAYAEILLEEGTPRVSLERAIDRFAQARKFNPNDSSPVLDTALALVWSANLVSDTSEPGARSCCERALVAAADAVKMNPRFYWTHRVLGDALALAARLDAQGGLDPSPRLLKAGESYQKALELSSNSPVVRGLYADSYRIQAEWELDSWRSPEAALAKARDALRLAGDTDDAAQAALDLIRAKWQMQQNHSPMGTLADAERMLRKSLPLPLGGPPARALLAEVHLLRARWLSAQGANSAHDLNQALDLTAQALRWEFTKNKVSLLRAGALLLRSRHGRAVDERCKSANEAQALLQHLSGLGGVRERRRAALLEEAGRLCPPEESTR
ncbi:MAG: serine/threonine-protein kinase [Acidobacteriota bacterium]